MEAHFYSIEDNSPDFPDLPEIIEKFSEIYDSRNRPEGDELDSQMDAMLTEVSLYFGIKHFSAPNNMYIFLPSELDLDMEKALEAIINSDIDDSDL